MTGWLIGHVPMGILVFFAGLLGEVFKLGIGVLLTLLCLAAAWFSPIFKKDFLYGAAVFGISTFVFAMGVHTGAQRVRAQWTAATEAEIAAGEQARTSAQRYVAKRPLGRMRTHDRFERQRP